MHLFNNKKGQPKKTSRIKEETEAESYYITLDILMKFLIVISNGNSIYINYF